MDFLDRLKGGLQRTRQEWKEKWDALLAAPRWDDEMFAAMEEILIAADVGVAATRRLLDAVRRLPVWQRHAPDLASCLQHEIVRMLARDEGVGGFPSCHPARPWVVMFVGVNGVGKTTAIGKLAAQYARGGRAVILAAADTFRAAAIEQLEVWGQRAGAEVVKHRPGQDPSGVAFDAVQAGKKRQADAVFIDTAGRLHTKGQLIEELKKMRRVVAKELPGAPHETYLVLDATTGQNSLQQAKIFKEALEVTGIILTKLDGTAKGGVVIAIQQELGLPVRFIGVGEEVDDLQPFEPERFVQALFA